MDVASKASKQILEKYRKECGPLAEAAYMIVGACLRAETQSRGIEADKLFDELAGDARCISKDAFCKKIKSLDSISVGPGYAKLLFESLGTDGIWKQQLLDFFHLYYTVLKEIALTDTFNVNDCRVLRKSVRHEVLQVLEGPVSIPELGIARVRARFLSDGLEGWISVKDHQGKPFLEEVNRPTYTCCAKMPLLQDESVGTGTVRMLEVDEIIELVAGPQKEAPQEVVRARVKVDKDGSTGWITIKTRSGLVCAEPNLKLYRCVGPGVLTDGESVKASNVLRKVVEGDMFEVVEEMTELTRSASVDGVAAVMDKDAGVARMRGKSLKDGKVGWITTRGSAGKVFAEAVTNVYVVLRESDLQKQVSSKDGVDVVRSLAVGETFQVVEGPKVEKTPVEMRANVRAVSDGSTGWVLMAEKDERVKHWSSFYKCLDAAMMRERGSQDAALVRELAQGDIIEVLEGPTREDGETRIRARTRDGTIGWVTTRTAEGTQILDCC